MLGMRMIVLSILVLGSLQLFIIVSRYYPKKGTQSIEECPPALSRINTRKLCPECSPCPKFVTKRIDPPKSFRDLGHNFRMHQKMINFDSKCKRLPDGETKGAKYRDEEFPFDVYPVRRQACPQGSMKRFGLRGDGGWDLCLTDSIKKPPCIIYGFGVGYHDEWDIEVATKLPCEVHSFDPTPGVVAWMEKRKRGIPDRMHFHPWGISNRTQDKKVFNNAFTKDSNVLVSLKTVTDIMSTLDHRRVDVVKLDIESHEWGVLDDILDIPGLEQLMLEFHFGKAYWWTEAIEKILRAGFRIYKKESGRYHRMRPIDYQVLMQKSPRKGTLSCRGLQEYWFIREFSIG